MLRHFLSHPGLGDRIAASEAATAPPGAPRPSLSAAEWQALRGICD
jgi:hypothetical protein